MTAGPVEIIRPAGGLLSVNGRCGRCGSPLIESEAWAYANLPLNDSDGPGRNFCGACDDDCRFYFEVPSAAAVTDWEEYREGNGMTSLREADRELIREAREQGERMAERLAAHLHQVEKWAAELDEAPAPPGLVQADREGYE